MRSILRISTIAVVSLMALSFAPSRSVDASEDARPLRGTDAEGCLGSPSLLKGFQAGHTQALSQDYYAVYLLDVKKELDPKKEFCRDLKNTEKSCCILGFYQGTRQFLEKELPKLDSKDECFDSFQTGAAHAKMSCNLPGSTLPSGNLNPTLESSLHQFSEFSALEKSTDSCETLEMIPPKKKLGCYSHGFVHHAYESGCELGGVDTQVLQAILEPTPKASSHSTAKHLPQSPIRSPGSPSSQDKNKGSRAQDAL